MLLFATQGKMIHMRPEQPEDVASIDELTRLTFKDKVEAELINAVRGTEYLIP